jgi:ParB-like chromosome segregation protein Spo0J
VSVLTEETGRLVALEQIRVPDNVRALDETHVQALAGSIALQGMLVPVVVRRDGGTFELVAGFHRVAAADRSAWPRCRSSCATPRPRMPTARWRTSRASS